MSFLKWEKPFPKEGRPPTSIRDSKGLLLSINSMSDDGWSIIMLQVWRKIGSVISAERCERG